MPILLGKCEDKIYIIDLYVEYENYREEIILKLRKISDNGLNNLELLEYSCLARNLT